MKEIIKPGYKKTPVGIIPEDWEVKELDSLFTFKNGLNADRTRYGKGVKFINVMEVIYSNSISPQDIPGTIEISEAQKKLYKVEYGDIVFNRTSETPEEVGLSAVYLGTEEVVFGGFVIRAKPRNKAINTLFKKYGFRSSPVRRQIIQRGQGAVRSNIGQKDLATVKIILPPHPEQKAIADCLSTWDRGIEKLTALIDAKKEQKKGLMQKLLTGSLRLRSATGEPFDGEWKEVRLKDIGFIPKKTPVKEIGNRRTLTVRLYVKGVIFSTNAKTKITSTGRKYYERNEGEILIGRQNIHNGGIGLVHSQHNGHICSNALTSFCVNEFHNRSFIWHLLSFPQIHMRIERYMSGTGQKEISEKELLKLNIVAPPIEEQTAIAQVLTTADREIELLEKKLVAMKEQKKGLMQVLLTGEKRLV